MLYLQNTLTGDKEKFIPIEKNKVGIYVCGVTLYDHIHIGHLKSILTFEILRNYFAFTGFKVKFVRNITDIDDKIISKAVNEGISPLTLVNQYIDYYHNLLDSLEINPPDEEPRVTQYLPKISQYIENLQSKGFAYKAADGIYFNTATIKNKIYPLSKKVINDLQESEDNKLYDKKNASDFALWKKDINHGYSSNIFNENGRPGWHIECSAMHYHTLGENFDIHGGGRDLIFPHHENEITQSVAHNGISPANYWIHNGMMTKDGKKLSKSLGNSIYVKDLLHDYLPEGIKLFLLKGQYNQSQEFSVIELKEAHERIMGFMSVLSDLTDNQFISFRNEIIDILEDNLNTPKAVVLIYQKIKELQENKSLGLALELLEVLKLLSVIGKNQSLDTLYQKWLTSNLPTQNVINLAEFRKTAKLSNDWISADQYRLEINKLGWLINDQKNGDYLLQKM